MHHNLRKRHLHALPQRLRGRADGLGVLMCLVVLALAAVPFVALPANRPQKDRCDSSQLGVDVSQDHWTVSQKELITRRILMLPLDGTPPTIEATHVVYAANQKYLMPLLASMNSLQKKSKSPAVFHVVTTQECLPAFQCAFAAYLPHATVDLVAFNDTRVRSLIKVWDGNEAHAATLNYARFYLPYIFPDLGEMVYVDPDTIVYSDVQELVLELRQQTRYPKVDLFFGAAESNLSTTFHSSYQFMLNCKDDNIWRTLHCHHNFFNAGVFVTDLRKWRKYDITGLLEYWLGQNKKRRMWRWGSQAPLGLVFYNQWFKLSPYWNFRQSAKGDFNPSMIPLLKIQHFTGPEKPWKSNGYQFWMYWCRHYPRSQELWFCRRNVYSNLIPTSLLDYSFILDLGKASYHFG